MNYSAFAHIIKAQRIAAGYNQAKAAELLYLSRSAYSHYEKGERVPSTETLIRMSALYHLHPVDLLGTLIPNEIKNEYPDYMNKLYCGKYDFTQEELTLADNYRSLSESKKDIVTKLMQSLNTNSAVAMHSHLH